MRRGYTMLLYYWLVWTNISPKRKLTILTEVISPRQTRLGSSCEPFCWHMVRLIMNQSWMRWIFSTVKGYQSSFKPDSQQKRNTSRRASRSSRCRPDYPILKDSDLVWYRPSGFWSRPAANFPLFVQTNQFPYKHEAYARLLVSRQFSLIDLGSCLMALNGLARILPKATFAAWKFSSSACSRSTRQIYLLFTVLLVFGMS